ncbi:MAG: glycosyltransferase family 4 protein [Promethearchaeota archaeon]
MNKPLNLVIITPYYVPFPGGQETHTYFLVKYLKDYNINITIITTNNPKQKKYEKEDNFEIYRLKPLFEFNSNPFCIKLFGLLMKIKADIFHTQGYWSFFANTAALVSKIRKIPLLYTSHGFQLTLFEKNFITRLIVYLYLKTIGRFMFKQMKLITVNHQQDKRILQNIGVKTLKIKILPSGLDLQSYEKVNTQITLEYMKNIRNRYNLKHPIILYIGRLVERKGLHYLLVVIPKLVEIFPDLSCIIIGNGPKEKYYKELVSNLNINNNVRFVGYLKPFSKVLVSLIKLANVQILPSFTESMPVSVMEGLFFKNPIMITDLHFAKWINYQNKKVYIPIDPINSDDFSEKIIRLLKNESLRKELGELGANFIREKFNWRDIAKETIEIYYKLLKRYDL